ncbi:MAG: AMP-binding protein [Rhodobacterales bacterium]|nr:AMP-binding protein [Rhodobacterales bacterium]
MASSRNGSLFEAVVKGLLRLVLRLAYRVEVRGLDNYAQAGPRAVIVVNHVSFLDAVLLAVFLPVKPMFAIDRRIAKAWWVRPFLALVDAFPMDPTNPMATKALIKEMRHDRHCVIFPEGRITVTGALMKVYEGPGLVADKAEAMVVPVRIDGAQYTPFSRLRGKVRIRRFPKITLTVLEPRRLDLPAEVGGRERRRLAGLALYDLMSGMIFETCERRQSLFDALLDARAIHGRRLPVVEDVERAPLTFNGLVLGALVLGRRLAALAPRGGAVGVMLPNANAAVATFYGLQAFGRVPAMLNFSAGAGNMLSAIRAAKLDTVVTSRRFVDQANLADAVAALADAVRVVYLEDVRDAITWRHKLLGLADRFRAWHLHAGQRIDPDEAALILFTSGSEGTPKGVVLSHANLLANRHQLGSRIDFTPRDTVFNALPLFHSFGLTGGLLLPLMCGARVFLYPSPLHYRIVPALVYDTNATVMFGTDTFLSGYARVAHPYDFHAVRYVFAGAEKVREQTRRVWADVFGLRILEGYGATETAPVIAANTPMHARPGTVGRLLPGIEHDLEPVEGIDDGGRLVVRGPNVMRGYLRAEAPGELDPPPPEGYDTGDIVTIDADGFVTIQGRAKRFAKIAGEMVSLGAVEAQAAALWPDHRHAAVTRPDDRKGEQIVLVTDNPDADRDALARHVKDQGLTELMVPRDVHVTADLPLLGTGKVDYAGVAALLDGDG